MIWSKFLSRKFLLAVLVVVFGAMKVLKPELVDALPWSVVGVALAYIFGEAGRDILRDYLDYKENQTED